MLKVVHLNASSSGGAYVAAQRLSKALNSTGEVSSEHLVFAGNLGEHTLWANSFVRKKYALLLHAIEKLDFLRYEKSKTERFAFSQGLTGIDVSNWKRVKEADLIHLHWINKGFISLNELERIAALNKPVVWTCHDMWPFTGGCYHNRGCDHYMQQCGNCRYLKNPEDKDLSFKVFAKKDQIYEKNQNITFVTPSNWLADRARENGMKLSNKLFVVPNGIDTKKFVCFSDKAKYRAELGIPEKKTVLFISANLSNPYKGFVEFITAMKQVYTQNKDFQIVVLGSRMPEIDLGDLPVVFGGLVSDEEQIVKYYNATDVYVSTSLEENLPTTLIESISCGTPVVAFNVGGSPDIIESDWNGLLFEKGNCNGIAKGVLQLLAMDEKEVKMMSENCRAKAISTFSADKVLNQMLEVYDQVLRKRM